MFGAGPLMVAESDPSANTGLGLESGLLGTQQGWVEAYTRSTYRRWFEKGETAGEEPNLSESLEEIGCDPSEVLAAAETHRTADQLAAATDEAMRLGIFGSPTFVVGGEVFWGDDRLDDALHWARKA
jgi:2-hydroxychromene-2-carboxylate isomerase